MTRRWFFIEPLDVLSFRDGRPFAAGEQHGLRSLFPPFPPTVLGALRAALLGQLCEGGEGRGEDPARCPQCNREDCPGWVAIGRNAERAPFSFILALPAGLHGGTPDLYWPPARDLFARVSRTDGHEVIENVMLARPFSLGALGAQTDLTEMSPVGVLSQQRLSALDLWLTTDGLAAALSGDPSREGRHYAKATDLWEHEGRVGIGLGEAKTARRGLFYQLQAVRPKPGVGLAVAVEGDFPLATPVQVRLGGEGRVVTVRATENARLPECPEQFPDGKVRLYLATPALFGGFRPPPLEGLDLVGAAVGRSEWVGGWDIASGRPRPLRSAVPAGSVFFYRASGDAAALASRYHGKVLSDDGRGFGFVLAGGW
jgi:CRISPR-associated protein Cmr3